ncbi:hypothetical protein LCGC14_1825890 [marine sediment metagenome]|uniref:Helix-turn-helix domain-containing protein n=1 Tax=marine sediment metagenome TaxID=412755 RepID=A0A0F9GHS2_9ZZZZ
MNDEMRELFQKANALTITEATALLKVRRVTLHRWMKSGRLQSYKLGHHRAIPRSEVERLLA